MGKIKLPETSYFYALAMKRSAELKRIANNPRCPMPDSVCKFCGAKATETHPIPGPGDVSFLVFECGSSVFSDGDSFVQTVSCKLSQRDQEIERLRKERDEARTAARTLLANMTPLKNGGVVYDSHNKWPWLKE